MAAVFFPEQSSNFFGTPKNMIFIFHVDVTGIYSVQHHEKKHENTSGDYSGPFLGTVRQEKGLVMTGTILSYLHTIL